MITLVIVGILSAVGVAGYSQYVKKARIAEAHVLIDNLKKLSVGYFVENQRFFNAGASGDAVAAISNGERVTLSEHSWGMSSTSDASEVFTLDNFTPAYEPINFSIQVEYGSPQIGNLATSSKIFAVVSEASGGNGKCTADTAIGDSAPSEYGVDEVSSGSHDWFSIAFIGNFSMSSTGECIFLIQTGQAYGTNLTTRPVLQLD